MMSIMRALSLHIRQQWTWKRLLPIGLYLLMYSLIVLLPYRRLAAQYQESYPLSIVAILMGSYWYVAIVMIGAILFCSVLPFRNSFQFWLVIKLGYARWMISQVVYVIVSSLAFVCFNVMLIWLLLLPHLNIRLYTWGKLLNALGQARIRPNETLQGAIQEVAMQYYTPSSALIQTLLLFWLLVILLGLIILVFNQLGPNMGLMLACGLVVESIFFSLAAGHWIFFLSPLNWLSIYQIKYEPHSGLPSLENVCLRLAFLYAILLGILSFRVKARKVRVK